MEGHQCNNYVMTEFALTYDASKINAVKHLHSCSMFYVDVLVNSTLNLAAA